MAADPYVDLYRSRRTQARGVALPAEPRVPANDSLTPLERAMADERENRTRLDIMTAPPADQVARQTRIAREAGVAPALVDDLDGAERAQNADKLGKVFGQYPAFGRWGAANPRGAVAAQDDHESLGALGRAYEVLAGRLQQTTQLTGKMGWGSVDYFNDLGDALAYPLESAIATVGRPFGININPDERRAKQRAISQGRINATDTAIAAADARAQTGNYWIDAATSGLASIAPSLAALGMGIVTRNPGAAAGFMGIGSGGASYAEARTQGLSLATATPYAAVQGGTEFLTERIPAGALVEAIAKKAPFGKTLVRQLGEEIKGENIATVVQDLTDWVYLPENANKTIGDYIRERPQAALDTTLATIGGTTAQTSIITAADRSVRAAAKLTDRVAQTNQARREGQFIDKFTKAVQGSKLNGRDPEAYAELVTAQAEESGATHIYIDGEAVRALYQSDSYDPDSDPFAIYEEQAFDPAGGDLVIPVGEAVKLVASPSWAALRDDMRMTAGGVTNREADDFDSAMEQVMADLTDEMAEREKGDAQSRTAIERLTDGIAAKFANAGLSAPNARDVATLLATRGKTRAERLGWDVTGNEYDALEVRSVLPDAVKPFVTRTEKGVDVSPDLINEVRAKRGPSLLEFVAKRGGISDPGGDLRSMGFAPLKGKAAKGQRKVISDTADAVDRVFEAAIEAGYFPDILGTAQERYADLPDPAVFLEALDREYRGSPVYAAGQATTAADAARAALEQGGYDPAKMSAKDIRDALAQMFEQDQREGLTQAVDTKSAAFKAWFKDSAVVDESGEPLIVYHGTGTSFESFAPERKGANTGHPGSGLGFFFGAKPNTAETYADIAARGSYGGQATGNPIVMPVYLSLQNPKRYGTASEFYAEADQWAGRDDEWRTSLIEAGFDGIVVRDDMEEIVAFKPEQIKSVNNRGTFDPNDARILYQPDSQGRPLVVVHNLSADKFRNADELGGLAAPSIAVIRADIDWTNFGDISLIGSPDLVDPKDKSAKGFNADVYSPRQPRAQFDLHAPTLKKLRADMGDVAKALGESFDTEFDDSKLSREGLAAIEQSPVAKLTFLRSIGQDVKIKRSEKPKVDKRLVSIARKFDHEFELRKDPAFLAALTDVLNEEIAAEAGNEADQIEYLRARNFEEDGGPRFRLANTRAIAALNANKPAPVDRWETRKAIDAKLDATKKRHAEFRLWVQDNYAGLIAGRFFEGRESGRRKGYTMENLVREMTRTIRDGEGFNYGVGSLRSNVAKQFRSIKEMQASRDSIVSDDAMDKIKTEVSDEMFALGEKFSRYHHSGEDFGWMDIFTAFLKDMSAGHIREWQDDIFTEPAPTDLLTEARGVLTKLRNLPTEYFEVKMQRAVKFSEFAGAAVPDNTDQDVIDRLKALGLRVETYPNGQSRQGAIDKIAGLTERRVYFQDMFDADNATDPAKQEAAKERLKLRAEAPLRGQNKTGKAQDGTMGLGLFDSDQRSLFQAAFHGSPHIFDKFSLSAIGTGEGAQAYGWGLYFAGRKEIAEHYRRSLSLSQNNYATNARNVLESAGVPIVENNAEYAGSVGTVASLQRAGYEAENGDDGGRVLLRLAPELRKLSVEEARKLVDAYLAKEAKGRTYTVEIPEDGEYLLWDKPLSEQPEKVKAALASLSEGALDQMAEMLDARGMNEIERDDDTYTGQELYRLLTRIELDVDTDGSNGKQDASLHLHNLGIAGIKYLDGGSRSAGDGSFNYVVFDDSRVSIQAYEQEYGEGARGRIIFDQNKAIIELFASRNLSTPLHELSHLWLEELRFDASLDSAPAQIKADWQTVTDWFASNGHPIGENGQIPTEAHELWARSGERYLMEGKAPSTALQRLFDTFRGWLTAIYKTVDKLRAPISPEIREVFDRLIATDEEIAAANERQNLAALFKTAADAAMSAPEFEAYQAQVALARTEAQGKLLDKTMARVRRARTKEWNDEAATVREQVTADVDDVPMFRALRAMKTDRISEEWVKGEGFDIAALPVRIPPLTKPGGADPELIAEQAGFPTAGDMLRTIIEAEAAHRAAKEGGDPRSMRARVIEDNTDAEMTRRHGDALNDGTIEREALEAVHNDMQGELIASELRALSRKTGKRATPYVLAKEWARNRIRSGKVVDEASPSAIQRYARAAAKAGREAEAAMLKGDADETFRQKQFQMLNNALVSQAKQAADEVDAAVKRMARIAKAKTMKSVDQDYLEQAQVLLEAVDLRRRTEKSLALKDQFMAWAQARKAEGFDIVVPDNFEGALQTNWTRLPVETLLSLDEAVKQIIHIGRYQQTLLDDKERREFEEVVNEALGGMGEGKPPSDLMEPSFWDRAKSRAAAIDAALLKMETVFDWLDGGNPNGVFNRIVFRPIAEAQHNATVRMAGMAEKLNAALEAVPAKTVKRWREKVTGPLLNRETGNPFVFTRDQLVSMALNMGNRGNIDKLTGGYGWNEQALRDFLNAELTAEEWTYVQTVWDTIDELWPEIEALEKRLNGVAPDKVEAEPIETPGGTLRGGYFPIVYDPRRNYDSEANAARGRDLFEAIYTRATTPKGFTKERTRVERPVHLSLGIISRHVAEVVHDITHREAIIQADKFLADRRIMRAVDETLSPEVRKQFRPWLQRIANQWAYDRAGTAGLEGFINKMRTNATIVGMGFRVSTMLMQAAGFSNSFEVVGGRWLTPAIARAAAHPVESFEFVMSRSGEVPTRMANLDRDIRDAARSAGGFEKLSAVKRYAFHGIGYMDRVVVIPTWLGAYDKAIAGGMSEGEAIYAADKAVRQSQGSGAAKDLAAVQSGRGTAGAALKLLTMFYSYMSAFYQRERTLGRDVLRGGVKDVPKLLARAWWLVVVPPLLAEILAGRGPGADDDDETWASWALESIGLSLVGPIPLVRDAAPVMVRKLKDQPSFGYRFTPAQGGVESLLRIADDIERLVDGEKTRRLTQSSIETVGYFTGLTTGQIAAATQFLVDVGQDEVDPEGFGDWYEGLTRGRIKEDAN